MSKEEWKSYKLGDIVDDIAMGPFGSNIKTDNFIDFGVPVIRGSNLNEGSFEDEHFVFISEEKAQSLKRSLAYPDDLVFTHRGTIGQVGIIPKDKHPKYLVSQSQMKLTVNKKYLQPRFLYYFFRSPVGQYELLKNASQVGVPAIASPTKSLKEIDIAVPSLDIQNKIASILSSIDEKIELNHQTAQTLEAIAQAIFKEWFVDFNFPGATGEMQESELGEIPEGWRVETLRNLIEIKNGFAFKGTDFIDEGVPVIKIKNVKAGKIQLETLSYVSREVADKAIRFKINYNDILISMSGNRIDGSPETWVGKVALFNVDGEYLLNQRVSIIKPKNEKEVSKYFLTQLMSSGEFQYFFISHATSSGGQANISPDLIYDIKITLPTETTMEKFHETVMPLYELIAARQNDNKILTQLRDNILPKLMKGELSLNDQTA